MSKQKKSYKAQKKHLSCGCWLKGEGVVHWKAWTTKTSILFKKDINNLVHGNNDYAK